MRLADLFQLRDDGVDDHDECDPPEKDRHREQADEARDHRMRADVGVAHADFTRQKVWAFTPSVVLWSLTTPSTVIRQEIEPPSLWATMFGLAAGAVVVRTSDHGNGTPTAFCGWASRSR